MKTSLARLAEKINLLVPDPQEASALEIGPGTSPILPYFPFRETYFLEQSAEITRTLAEQEKKRRTKTRSHFIVGDILKLPFSKTKRFDLVVMNEVLTHVRSSKRVGVVKKVASMSNALLIVERPQGSYAQFLKQLYPEMFGQRTKTQLKDIYSTYTRIQPLVKMLKDVGWVVKTEKVISGETYCILYARRKKNNLSA